MSFRQPVRPVMLGLTGMDILQTFTHLFPPLNLKYKMQKIGATKTSNRLLPFVKILELFQS